MFYFKLIAKNGDILGAEQFETLQYVRQLDNGYVIRSSEYNAQGIISCNQEAIYQLDGRPVMTGDYARAVAISGDEYKEIVPDEDKGDPDDETPSSEDVMTREELTAKVAELEEQNAMLMECVMEMSEIVYA